MTRQNLLSKNANLCIITLKSRFSHDAPKTLIFYAFLRGKAGFLITRQIGEYLLHCYVSKQGFS